MARQEQVLVLEPQHELKFRGNTGTEGRARGQLANLETGDSGDDSQFIDFRTA